MTVFALPSVVAGLPRLLRPGALYREDPFLSLSSRDQMRRHQRNELSRTDDLCRLPEPGKMPLIPGNQVIGARFVGTFQE